MKLSVAAIIVVSCLAMAAPAPAQERGFVRALGGATFGTADPSSIIGGGGGLTVSPGVQITGDIGRIQNVMPTEIQDFLDLVSALFTLETGIPIDINATAPAFYATGGLRYSLPATGAMQPFVEAQAGIASISFDVQAEAAGVDLSDEVEDEADLESMSEVLIGFGGGLAFRLTESLGLDVGYRFHRIFTEDPAVNVNAIYGALRVVFR